jgi:hypothetical protein
MKRAPHFGHILHVMVWQIVAGRCSSVPPLLAARTKKLRGPHAVQPSKLYFLIFGFFA